MIRLAGRIWVETENGKLLGHGRIELLERVHACGSLRQAALQMGMSYKRAWDLIGDMNNQFAQPLTISTRGGKGGGKAVVTPKGLAVIAQYRKLLQQFDAFLAETKTDISL